MTDKASSGTDSRNYGRLLPCPFCGGEPNEQHFNVTPNLPGRLICSCGAEMRQGRNQSSADLTAAWNTRACGQCESGAVPMTEEAMAEHGWLRGRTCYVVGTICSDGWTIAQDPLYYHELSCGHEIETLGKEPPSYCPECGAKVVSADE